MFATDTVSETLKKTLEDYWKTIAGGARGTGRQALEVQEKRSSSVFLFPQKMPGVIKEALALRMQLLERKLPEGFDVSVTYSAVDGSRSFFVWRAPSKEALDELLNQYPVTRSTLSEIVPVMQSYPVTEEYVISMYQRMMTMPRPPQ